MATVATGEAYRAEPGLHIKEALIKIDWITK